MGEKAPIVSIMSSVEDHHDEESHGGQGYVQRLSERLKH